MDQIEGNIAMIHNGYTQVLFYITCNLNVFCAGMDTAVCESKNDTLKLSIMGIK